MQGRHFEGVALALQIPALVVVVPGHPEVGDERIADVVHQNVQRLDVAVDVALRVDALEAYQEHLEQRLIVRDRLLLDVIM